MPGPKPPAVPLSEAERQELLRLIRAHTTPQHYSFRSNSRYSPKNPIQPDHPFMARALRPLIPRF